MKVRKVLTQPTQCELSTRTFLNNYDVTNGKLFASNSLHNTKTSQNYLKIILWRLLNTVRVGSKIIHFIYIGLWLSCTQEGTGL